MYKSKMLFLTMTMMGTFMTMSSNNWISMWMGLELNMMSFIPLMYKKSNKSSEASMIYFLVQSMSSMLLMFSILMMNLWEMQYMYMNMIMLMSLLMKLGSAPFHMWMPEMMAKLSWPNCFMLMTWQKMGPMMMINNLKMNETILWMAVMMSVIVGSVGGLNQSSLRKLMAYSSINHLGWMLSMSNIQNNWLIYLTIYSIINLMMCYTMNHYNMLFMNQMNSINMSLGEKLNYSIMLMSLGGLPPFLGFLSKWIVIQTLMENNLTMMMIIMVMTSIITLYYYLRVTTGFLLTFQHVNKWINTNKNTMLNMMSITINMSLPLMVVTNFL